jgi:hypothetical protein
VPAVVKIPDCVAADTSGSLTKLSGIFQSRGQFDKSTYSPNDRCNLNLGQIKIINSYLTLRHTGFGSMGPRPCKNMLYFRYVLSNSISVGLISTFSTFGVF